MTAPSPRKAPARTRAGSPASGAPVLVGVVGGSGSGKTWLARELKRRLDPDADILSLDDFYADLSHLPAAERAARNFDTPRAIDWAVFQACLESIRRGEPVLLPRYDFAAHARLPHRRAWEPRRVLVVEGLWLWRRRSIARLFALKVFRAGSEAARFARRLERDVVERGRSHDSIHSQWHAQVEPSYRRFVLPQRRTADVTLEAQVSEAELAGLVGRIRAIAGL